MPPVTFTANLRRHVDASDAGVPDFLWSQHHNGVFRSTDGAKSWSEVKIYRHGLDATPHGRTLAMGSTTGALRVSRDSGESWMSPSRDLPPVYCVRFA